MKRECPSLEGVWECVVWIYGAGYTLRNSLKEATMVYKDRMADME